MRFGLPKDTIQKINAVFTSYTGIEKVIIYGSRAKENYKNGSDIDLTIVGKTLTLNDLFKVENALDELLLPYKIDLSLFHHINNADLIEHIERVGQVFFNN